MRVGSSFSVFTSMTTIVAVLVVACQMHTTEVVPADGSQVEVAKMRLSAVVLPRTAKFESESDLNQFKVEISRHGDLSTTLKVFRSLDVEFSRRTLVGTIARGETTLYDSDVNPRTAYLYRVEIADDAGGQKEGANLRVTVFSDAVIRGKFAIRRDEPADGIYRYHRLLIYSDAQILTNGNGFVFDADEILIHPGARVESGEVHRPESPYPFSPSETIVIRAKRATGPLQFSTGFQAVDIRVVDGDRFNPQPKDAEKVRWGVSIGGERYFWCGNIPLPASKVSGVYGREQSGLEKDLIFISAGYGRVYRVSLGSGIDSLKRDAAYEQPFSEIQCEYRDGRAILFGDARWISYREKSKGLAFRLMEVARLHESAEATIVVNRLLRNQQFVAESYEPWERNASPKPQLELIQKHLSAFVEIMRQGGFQNVALGAGPQNLTRESYSELSRAIWPAIAFRDIRTMDPSFATYLNELHRLYPKY